MKKLTHAPTDDENLVVLPSDPINTELEYLHRALAVEVDDKDVNVNVALEGFEFVGEYLCPVFVAVVVYGVNANNVDT